MTRDLCGAGPQTVVTGLPTKDASAVKGDTVTTEDFRLLDTFSDENSRMRIVLPFKMLTKVGKCRGEFSLLKKCQATRNPL